MLLGHYANNEKVKITLNGQDVTDKVNFTSTNDNIAFIDENGIIRIVEEGEVNVIVHLDGANDTIVHIKVNKIGDTPYNPDIEYQYSNIYETEDGILIYKGETGDLDVIIDGLDKTNSIIYTSANETIATVNSEKGHGKIHGLEVGKTVISIKYENTNKGTDSILTKINVTVLPKPELEKDLFSMLVGTTDQIRVNLHTANITNDCEYTTNDNKIAKVDETGKITSVGCKVIGAVTGQTNLQAQYTDPKTGRVFNLPITVNTYKKIIPSDGGGNATTLTDEEKERLKEILLDTGMISNEHDVDEIIVIDENGDVQIVIHTGEKEGTKIAVISEDGTTIKYISTEEVDENGDITVNPSDSDNEIGTINEDGTLKEIIVPGFYDANNRLIASWQDVTGDKIVDGALVFDENGNKVTIEDSERSDEYQGTKCWYYEQHSNINGGDNPDDYHKHPQHFTQILNEHPELGNTATKLVMPEGVRVIGHYAFVDCNMKLDTIVFSNTYDGITVNADGTESFESIGGSMSRVGTSYPKRQLLNYVIRTGNPYFESEDGIVYSEDFKTLVACPMNKQKVIVKDGCEIFEECAFDGNRAITSVGPIGSGADVEVPETVTTLYCRTFRISTLEWVEFWDGLTCFGYPDIDQKTPDGTGEHAKDITSDVNANGSQIFKDCKELKYVYIPASVTKMGYTYNAQNKKFESFAQGADSKTKLYCEIEQPTENDGIYPEGWNAFWNSRGGNDINRITPTWNYSRDAFQQLIREKYGHYGNN